MGGAAKSFSAPCVQLFMNLLHVGRYFKDPNVAPWRKAVAVFAVLYALSPVDLIPDVLPVIGWLDDVGVLGLGLAWLSRDVSKYARRPGVQVVEGEVLSPRR